MRVCERANEVCVYDGRTHELSYHKNKKKVVFGIVVVVVGVGGGA